jgi:hypothetical protein
MSNFKIDKYIKNLTSNQQTYATMLVNEFRKNKKFKEEKFSGDGISCGQCLIKFSAKHLTIESPIELQETLVTKINKKLQYKNKVLKIVYSKNITPETIKEIVNLYL